MPLSAGAKAGLQAGAGFLSQMFGWIGQRRQEKRQWDREMDMYNLQKKDALNFWNMENQYNSPEMQMQRLKAAGLNPNLVYGNGADAMGGNINPPEARVSDQASNMARIYGQLPQNVGDTISQIYSLKLMDAQANKTKEEALTQKSIRDLQASQANLNSLLANKTALETSLGKDTYEYKVKQAQQEVEETTKRIGLIGSQTRVQDQTADNLQLQKAKIAQDITIDWQRSRMDLKTAYKNLLKMDQEIQLIKANIGQTQAHTKLLETEKISKEVSTALDSLEYTLNTMGLSKNESGVSRIINSLWSSLMDDIGTPAEQVKSIEDAIQDIRNQYGKRKSNPNALGAKGAPQQY